MIFVTQMVGTEQVCRNNSVISAHYTVWPSECSNYTCEMCL